MRPKMVLNDEGSSTTMNGTKAVMDPTEIGSTISHRELVCDPLKPTNTLLGWHKYTIVLGGGGGGGGISESYNPVDWSNVARSETVVNSNHKDSHAGWPRILGGTGLASIASIIGRALGDEKG